MIVGQHSTLVVEPGWQAAVIEDGIIELPARLTTMSRRRDRSQLRQHVRATIPCCWKSSPDDCRELPMRWVKCCGEHRSA